MKRSYILIFLLAIFSLSGLTIAILTKLGNAETNLNALNFQFNLLSGIFGYLIFSFTAVLITLAHFIIYKKNMKSLQKYLLLGLPYLLFVSFTLVNYKYIYELYNVFQERTGQVIDTPDMGVLALNMTMFALTIGLINLALVKVFSKNFEN